MKIIDLARKKHRPATSQSRKKQQPNASTAQTPLRHNYRRTHNFFSLSQHQRPAFHSCFANHREMARESHLQNFLEPENEIEKRDTQNGGDYESGGWRSQAWEDTRFISWFLLNHYYFCFRFEVLEGLIEEGGGFLVSCRYSPHHYHNWKFIVMLFLSWIGFASLRSIVVVLWDVCLGLSLRLWSCSVRALRVITCGHM